MKKTALFFLTLLFSVSGYGQQFAPLGAEWYNEGLRSIFHIQVVRDTVINNITARQVSFTPHTIPQWVPTGFQLYTPHPQYVYNNDDTVFLYNTLFKKFTPLYVFNVTDGDTLTLPLSEPQGCAYFMGSLSDSLYSVVVDSVRAVLYDTSYLQTVYTHSLSIQGRQKMSFPVYARVLGGVSTGLLPKCDSCAFILSDNCAGPYDVRCYNSSSHKIKLVNDDCAKGVKVSVPTIMEGIAVTLYPNPVSERITLRFSNPFKKQTQFILTDLAGREVYSASVSAMVSSVDHDVSSLQAGQYNATLFDGDNIVFRQKVVLMR